MRWIRTWPDDANDGVLVDDGNRFGRVYRYWDGRWRWCSWCWQPCQGLADTKEEAKREVESRTELDTLMPQYRKGYDRLRPGYGLGAR